MVHNAHTYAQPFHGPQCTHIRTTLAALTSPTHVPQCTRFYLLTSVFRGSEHKRNICFEEKKPQCVCKNALERERVYTHLSREYGNGFFFFFFFLSLFCFRVLQSKSSHIPMTFFWGGKHIIFLILIKPTTSSNFFSFFFITYMSYSLHKNRRCNKGKKLFHSHTHAHTYTLTQSYPFGLSSPMYRRVPSPIWT